MNAQQDSLEAGLDTGNLPIKLVFIAGEMEIPLCELERIGPGYVFDTRQAGSGQVEIRANGASIGNGELVEIDGRVGVRILTCL